MIIEQISSPPKTHENNEIIDFPLRYTAWIVITNQSTWKQFCKNRSSVCHTTFSSHELRKFGVKCRLGFTKAASCLFRVPIKTKAMSFTDLLTAIVIYIFANFIIQLSLYLLTCHSGTDKALFPINTHCLEIFVRAKRSSSEQCYFPGCFLFARRYGMA